MGDCDMGRHHSRGSRLLNSDGMHRLTVLVTDRPRQGPPEAGLTRGLRRGDAVLLRDYPAADRPALARRWRAITRARGLVLIIAGDIGLALTVGADGLHLPGHLLQRPDIQRQPRPMLVTAAVHDRADLVRARRLKVDLVLVSPVLPTRSHPGARVLGPLRFRALATRAGLPVLALGGMTAATFRQVTPCPNLKGFAAIDAFAR